MLMIALGFLKRALAGSVWLRRWSRLRGGQVWRAGFCLAPHSRAYAALTYHDIPSFTPLTVVELLGQCPGSRRRGCSIAHVLHERAQQFDIWIAGPSVG